MNTLIRTRLVVTVAAVLVVLGWARTDSRAHSAPPTAQAGGGGGEAGDDTPRSAPKVHVALPITGRSAKIWVALQSPVAMPFAHETPLEDVIKHIRTSTVSKDLPEGLPVYINPIGLQEAEKTTSSPITFAMDAVPLGTSLKLMLEQLGLSYRVHPDGFIVIDAEDSPRLEANEPTLQILDELRALRTEVEGLRAQVSMLRGAGGVSGTVQSPPGGAMRGMMGGGLR